MPVIFVASCFSRLGNSSPKLSLLTAFNILSKLVANWEVILLVGALLIYFKACLLLGFTEKGIRENFMFYVYLGRYAHVLVTACLREING